MGSAEDRDSKVSYYKLSSASLVLGAVGNMVGDSPGPSQMAPMAPTGDKCPGKGRAGMRKLSANVAWLFPYEHLQPDYGSPAKGQHWLRRMQASSGLSKKPQELQHWPEKVGKPPVLFRTGISCFCDWETT